MPKNDKTMNKSFIPLLYIAALLFAGITPLTAAPTVSNLRVAQRDGTNLVDVYYDLSGSSEDGATVTVELSENGGASYGLPISSLSGNVGSEVANGTNRHLVWDAGADLPDHFSETMRLRLIAESPPLTGEFALIPAGDFQMGDSFGEGYSHERPVHTVNVSAFFMGKHEVTKALWDEVRAWGVLNGYTDLPAGKGKGAKHPVYYVNWYGVVKWCNARSEKDGLEPCYTYGGATYKTGLRSTTACDWNASGYRLPTEAEWEKAARGGLEGKRYPWGNTISFTRANYSIYINLHGPESYALHHPDYSDGVLPYTSPVGSFAPNGYGLFDVTGNIPEWCWDWIDGTYYDSSPAIDPRGPSLGSSRSVRGGAWHSLVGSSGVISGSGVRIAGRRANHPSRYFHTPPGFRLARSSVPQ